MDTENKDLVNNIPEDDAGESLKEAGEEFTSTLDIDKDDINFELERYGITEEKVTEEEASADEEISAVKKKPFIIQKPIIIAAVSFLLVAILVLGSVFIYRGFFQKGVEGSWDWVIYNGDEPQSIYGDGGMYFVFDSEKIYMTNGSNNIIAAYSTEKGEDGNLNITSKFFTDFLGLSAETGKVTFSDNGDKMEISFGENASLNFLRKELPALKNDPKALSHASVDEAEIKSMAIDEKLVGTWKDEMETSFTFNADGTGEYKASESVVLMQYYSDNIEVETTFIYTTYNGEILVTFPYYNGEKGDMSMKYSFDGETLVMEGIGYKKAQ